MTEDQYFDVKGNPFKPPSAAEEIYYDAKGNPIKVNQSSSEPPSNKRYSSVSEDASKEAPSFWGGMPAFGLSNILFDTGKAIYNKPESVLPVAGGLLGSMAGPIGMGTGSLAGSLMQKMIENAREDKSPIPSGTDVAMSALQSAPDFALPLVGEALSGGPPTLRAKLANKLFGGSQVAEREAALSRVPGANPTVSQMTGSKAADLMESFLAPSTTQAVKAGNVPLIENVFGNYMPGDRESRTGAIRTAIARGQQFIKDKLKSNSDSLLALGEHNTIGYDKVVGQQLSRNPHISPMEDVLEHKEVSGPIYFQKAVDAADEFLNSLRKSYGKESNVDIVPFVPEADRSLVRYAEAISKTKTTGEPIKNATGPIQNMIDQTGVHPVDLKTALDWKTSTGSKGWGGDTNLNRLWKNLNRSISSDIETSLPHWQGGSQAALNYQNRNQLGTTLNDLYTSRGGATKNLLTSEGGTSGMANVDEILRDPVKISKAVSASANPVETRKNLLGNWVENLYSDAKSFDDKTLKSNFDGSKLMNAFLDPKNEPILKKLMPNATDRTNLGEFFKAVSVLGPGDEGNKYLQLRMANRATNVAIPILSGGLMGSPATAAGVGTAEVGLHEFVKRVLLNPEVARLLPRAANLPLTSPEGRAISRLIFTALKGTEINLTDSTGKETGKAKIGPDGIPR